MVHEDKLLLAVKQHDLVTVKKIIQKNIKSKSLLSSTKVNKLNLDLSDVNGMTPLHHAALTGNFQILDSLLSAGSKVDLPDDLGQRPLHCASAKGHIDVVDMLLSAGSASSPASADGSTPLHLAAVYNHTRVAERLLIWGADPNAVNQTKKTPLDFARSNNNQEMINLLTDAARSRKRHKSLYSSAVQSKKLGEIPDMSQKQSASSLRIRSPSPAMQQPRMLPPSGPAPPPPQPIMGTPQSYMGTPQPYMGTTQPHMGTPQPHMGMSQPQMNQLQPPIGRRRAPSPCIRMPRNSTSSSTSSNTSSVPSTKQFPSSASNPSIGKPSTESTDIDDADAPAKPSHCITTHKPKHHSEYQRPSIIRKSTSVAAKDREPIIHDTLPNRPQVMMPNNSSSSSSNMFSTSSSNTQPSLSNQSSINSEEMGISPKLKFPQNHLSSTSVPSNPENISSKSSNQVHNCNTVLRKLSDLSTNSFPSTSSSPFAHMYALSSASSLPNGQIYAPSNTSPGSSNQIYAPSNASPGSSSQIYAPSNASPSSSNQIYAPSNQIYAPSNQIYAPSNQIYAPSNISAGSSNQIYAPSLISSQNSSSSGLSMSTSLSLQSTSGNQITNARQKSFSPSSNTTFDAEFRQNLKDTCFAIQAKANVDYRDPGNPLTISFKAGDLITVLRTNVDPTSSPDTNSKPSQGGGGMWKGFVTSQGVGQTGLFPGYMVTPCTAISTAHNNTATPSLSSNRRAAGVPASPLIGHSPSVGSGMPFSRSMNAFPGPTPNQGRVMSHSMSQNFTNSDGTQRNRRPPSLVMSTSQSANFKLESGSATSPVAETSPTVYSPLCPLPPQMTALHTPPHQLSSPSQWASSGPLSPLGSISSGSQLTAASGPDSGSIQGASWGPGGVESNRNSIASMDSGRGSGSENGRLPGHVASPPYNSTNHGFSDPTNHHFTNLHLDSSLANQYSSISRFHHSPSGGEGHLSPYNRPLTIIGNSTPLSMAEKSDAEALYQWLMSIGMAIYFNPLFNSGYDLSTLTRATLEDLMRTGVTDPDHRRHIKAELDHVTTVDTLPNFIPDNVSHWLKLLGMEQYLTTLRDHGCTSLATVCELTWEDLAEIGIATLGHQKKMSLAIERLIKLYAGTKPPVKPSSLGIQAPSHQLSRSCDQLDSPHHSIYSNSRDLPPTTQSHNSPTSPLHSNSSHHTTSSNSSSTSTLLSPPAPFANPPPSSKQPLLPYTLPSNHSTSPSLYNSLRRRKTAISGSSTSSTLPDYSPPTSAHSNTAPRPSKSVSNPVPPKRTTSIPGINLPPSGSNTITSRSTNDSPHQQNDSYSSLNRNSNQSDVGKDVDGQPISLSRSPSASSSTGGVSKSIPFANENVGTVLRGANLVDHTTDTVGKTSEWAGKLESNFSGSILEDQLSFEKTSLPANDLDQDMANICEMLEDLTEELDRELYRVA